MKINKEIFGSIKDGQSVDLITLSNNNGMAIKICTFGGIIQSLSAADRDGKYDDVVLGYDTFEEYLDFNPHFGAITGRFANRIANGKFVLEDIEYRLPQNEGQNHLHGGIKAFDKVIWNAKTDMGENSASVQLSYLSKDGEEGYPGNLEVLVTYTLFESDQLLIAYHAITDKATPLNLTNHSYFNLSKNKSNILSNELWINYSLILLADEGIIPHKEIKDVTGTPFNFQSTKQIGLEINRPDKQLKRCGGYDHCMILNNFDGQLKHHASLYENNTGRLLEVYTEEPALQLYTGNKLDGSIKGKKGETYHAHSGVCLETQHFPDSPNRPDFPNTILYPGETYQTKTVFKFLVK